MSRYKLREMSLMVVREAREARERDIPQRRVACVDDAAAIAKKIARLADDGRKHFWTVCLEGPGNYIGHFETSRGGVNTAMVDKKVVFREAIVAGASYLFFVHNHPCGDPTPSEADRTLTRALAEGADLIGMRVLYHIVVGDGTDEWESIPV